MMMFVSRIKSLPSISFNNGVIGYSNINSFLLSERKLNDKNNKIREAIISAIINSAIPNEYYLYSLRWNSLRKKVSYYVSAIVKNKYPDLLVENVKCIIRAGRGFNYDFTFTINELYEFNIELKFNADTIEDTPQFVSPMKPSQYLSNPFEEYYYDNYLVSLLQEFALPIPDREIYLKYIHNNKPKCMEEAQLLYYQGCKQSSKFTGAEQAVNFYQKCNESSRECIKNCINLTELNIEKLTQYLINSQDKKNYLLFKNSEFYIQTSNSEDYTIVSYSKNAERSRYEAITKNGKTINILLRWKNGNGIAYPAFQIS
jgi:hypothetical protein